jgi:hypothetical protein
VVLAEVDAAAFEPLEAALLAELAPVGVLQAVLAQPVVSAAWRRARADRIEAEVLADRRYADGGLGLALIRDSNGSRTMDTVVRYRGAALAKLWRSLRTLQALQTEPARPGADLPAATVPALRRARHLLADRNEPTKARQINTLSENRAVDRTPDTPDRSFPNTAPTPPAIAPRPKPTQESTPSQRHDLKAPRRSHHHRRDLPDTRPAAPASWLAGTKQTREIAPHQHFGLRAT